MWAPAMQICEAGEYGRDVEAGGFMLHWESRWKLYKFADWEHQERRWKAYPDTEREFGS